MIATESKIFGIQLNAGVVFLAGLFVVVWVLLATNPLPAAEAAAGAFGFLGLLTITRRRLELWQLMVLAALASYVVLNYGFDNLAIPLGGVGIPVGETILLAALGLAMLHGWARGLSWILRDPPIVCLLAVMIFAGLHLLVDIPRYGIYALRDSSMFFDSFLLFIGLIWAREPRSVVTVARWLMLLFAINLAYTFSFPWAEKLQSISPVSGVFHPVPLLGNYQEISIYLLTGVAFCLWIAPEVFRLPRWICWSLAVAQLCGLALLQARSMYLGIVVVLMVLFLLGQTKKMMGLATMLPIALLALVALIGVTTLLGVRLQGRVGPVDFAFLKEHAKSLLSVGREGGGMEDDADRKEWYGEIWARSTSSVSNLLVGQGFGEPLVDFKTEQGIVVRQPHNSSLSVFARLGVLGFFFWLAFLFLVARRFVRAIRWRIVTDDLSSQIVLLLFLFFLLALIQASVQPSLEFSHGAFPFYFLTGFGLGIIRWRERETMNSTIERAA